EDWGYTMSSLSRELVFLILQFLDEEKFKETVHKLVSLLEQESGFYFNMKYFEDEVHNGNWDNVERYLSGFTKVDDNRYSMKIFFEIRKQKYLEALDKHDRSKAVEILVKDLKVFASFNEELFKEITQLLTLENFRFEVLLLFPTPLAGWMSNPSAVTHPVVSGGAIGLNAPTNPGNVVWDATSGTKQYTFEGHEAPVYSVCPHHKENIQISPVPVWAVPAEYQSLKLASDGHFEPKVFMSNCVSGGLETIADYCIIVFDSATVYPLVIAAHPSEPNQFALGLTDGGVHVLEPLESEGKWGVNPPTDNGSASSISAPSPAGASNSDQPQR
ncbi:hypothetical protein GW17_00019931, partial [Ensete ventricosum]